MWAPLSSNGARPETCPVRDEVYINATHIPKPQPGTLTGIRPRGVFFDDGDVVKYPMQPGSVLFGIQSAAPPATKGALTGLNFKTRE